MFSGLEPLNMANGPTAVSTWRESEKSDNIALALSMQGSMDEWWLPIFAG